jgi:WD40 repeat protein
VSFGEGRPNTRRRQMRTQLAAGEVLADFDEVLDHLVAARLITIDGDGRSNDDRVDLCHDTLITAWPSFAAWVDVSRADEVRRRQIQASADEWVVRGRGISGLLDEGELATAVVWRRTDAARELGESAEVTALIEASQVAIRLAEAERSRVQRSLGERYRDAAARALATEWPQRAVPYLVMARQHGIDDAGLRTLFRAATTSSVLVSLRHGGGVTSASFSDDGARVVTSSLDGTARLWDTVSGAPLTPPLVHPRAVKFAAVRSDGTRVLTLDEENETRIWDVTSTPTAIALASFYTKRAMFSAEGTMVVTSGGGKLEVRNADTGALLALPSYQGIGGSWLFNVAHQNASWGVGFRRQDTIELCDARTLARVVLQPDDDVPAYVGTVAFSSDGSRLVTLGVDTVQVWDAATGRPIRRLELQDEAVYVAINHDGSQVAIVEHDRVQRLHVATGKLVGLPLVAKTRPDRSRGPRLQVEYCRNGARLLCLSASDPRVSVWDAASGGILASIDQESNVLHAAVSMDGTRVVTASADGIARVWSVTSLERRVIGAGESFRDARYSPDGARIATVDQAVSRVRVWSSASEPELDTWLHEFVTAAAAFDRDGEHLALIGHDGSSVLDPRNGSKLKRFPPEPMPPPEKFYKGPAPGSFSPDGRSFATTGAPRSARIWNVVSSEPVTPPLMHEAKVSTVRFSPDGCRVITASEDGTARVWDARSGALLDPHLAHPAGVAVMFAAFSPDGRQIATTGSDHRVRLWATVSGQLQAALAGHVDRIIATEFAPDGTLLLTASWDGSARIWNTATCKLAAPLEHAAGLSAAGFSPDGSRVVTASDNLVRLWDARTGEPLGLSFAHSAPVYSAVFSPDGSTVLTASQDAVRVWDVGLDDRSLDEWRRIAGTGSYPELVGALSTEKKSNDALPSSIRAY